MASPDFHFASQANGLKYQATAAGSVVATLDSLSGVRSVVWTVIATDELSTAAARQATIVLSGSLNSICTLTAGAAGTAGILKCEINAGVDLATGLPNSALCVSTGKWFVPAANGLEVICAGEETQSNATFGWAEPINETIRAASGGGGGGSGDVVGPATATDNALARYDGTTGELLQDSAVTVSDSGNVTITGGGGGGNIILGSGNTVDGVDPSALEARTITAGAGLTGGGDLSASRTLAVGAGTGITVNADDIAVAYGTSAGTALQGNTAVVIGSGTPVDDAIPRYIGSTGLAVEPTDFAAIGGTNLDKTAAGSMTIGGANATSLLLGNTTTTLNRVNLTDAGEWQTWHAGTKRAAVRYNSGATRVYFEAATAGDTVSLKGAAAALIESANGIIAYGPTTSSLSLNDTVFFSSALAFDAYSAGTTSMKFGAGVLLAEIKHTQLGGTGVTAGAHLDIMSQAGQNAAGLDPSNPGGNIRIKPGASGSGEGAINGSNIAMFGNGSFGNATGVVWIGNATTVPSADPVGGFLLYASAGALVGRGSSGTNLTIHAADPHCPECGRDYVYEVKNSHYGEHLTVCWPCLLDALEAKGVDLSKAAFVRELMPVPERDVAMAAVNETKRLEAIADAQAKAERAASPLEVLRATKQARDDVARAEALTAQKIAAAYEWQAKATEAIAEDKHDEAVLLLHDAATLFASTDMRSEAAAAFNMALSAAEELADEALLDDLGDAAQKLGL